MRIATDNRRNANPGAMVRTDRYWQQVSSGIPHRDANIWQYDGDAVRREMARRLERLGLPEYAPKERAPIARPDRPVRWAARAFEIWNRLPAGDCSEDVVILEHLVWIEGKTSEGTKHAYVVAWRRDVCTVDWFRTWAELCGTLARQPIQLEPDGPEIEFSDPMEEGWAEWRRAEDRRARIARQRKAAAAARKRAARGRNAWGTGTVRSSGFRPEGS